MLPCPPRDSLPDHAMVSGGAGVDAWPTLLVVDSDAEMVQILVCYFERHGFQVSAGASFAEAKTFLRWRRAWSLIISDYHLPDGTGMDLLNWARNHMGSSPPVLLMSGSPHAAVLCAGVDYLAKPFPATALESRVRSLLGRKNA